jgi:hypothetical protein
VQWKSRHTLQEHPSWDSQSSLVSQVSQLKCVPVHGGFHEHPQNTHVALSPGTLHSPSPVQSVPVQRHPQPSHSYCDQ